MKTTRTQEETQALENLIDHFKLPFILVVKHFSDARIKSKFVLVMVGNPVVGSPTLNYDQMNHFILGMGMAKEYIK